MNRRSIVARVINATGVLLLIAAAIHLLVTPTLKRVILDRVLTPDELHFLVHGRALLLGRARAIHAVAQSFRVQALSGAEGKPGFAGEYIRAARYWY